MHRMLQRIDAPPRPFRWTRDQYYLAAEHGLFHDRHVQLIDGEIYEMSPQGDTHALLIPIIYEILKSVFGQGFTVRPQLPLVLGQVSDPEPDLAVVRGTPREQRKHPASAVLVVEVADSSLAFDATQKAALYARAGIEDYWIVNLAKSQLDVYRNPVVDPKLEFGAGYVDVRSFGRDESVTPLAARGVFVRVLDILP